MKKPRSYEEVLAALKAEMSRLGPGDHVSIWRLRKELQAAEKREQAVQS